MINHGRPWIDHKGMKKKGFIPWSTVIPTEFMGPHPSQGGSKGMAVGLLHWIHFFHLPVLYDGIFGIYQKERLSGDDSRKG